MVEFLIFCIPTLLYLVIRRRDPRARATMGLSTPRPSGRLLAVVLSIVKLGIGWLTTLAVPPEVLHGPGTAGRITGIMSGVVVALRAVGEEVFFRGFLQGLVAGRFGALVGILVQGSLFCSHTCCCSA